MADLRRSVTHKAGKVWANNNYKDLYTGWRKDKVVDEFSPEVDHIVECQMGVHLWESVEDGRRTTRQRLAPVRELWNDVDNLNNTPDFLNQKKGDAFEVWLDGKETDLRSALIRYNVASNQRTKIVVAFEEAAGWLACELDAVAEDTGVNIYGDIASMLDHWRERTG